MSILIKGMEMPTSCWRCPFCLTVDPDTYRCIPTGQEFESTFDAIDHIVLDCPLVEVPPHGDLIDRDALYKSFGASGNCNKCDLDAYKCQYYTEHTLMEFCERIDDAPTIIPAEEGET